MLQILASLKYKAPLILPVFIILLNFVYKFVIILRLNIYKRLIPKQ